MRQRTRHRSDSSWPLLVAAVVFALGAGGGDSGGDYKVRAIFNNASFLIPGEDVKVAGAKVGVVESLDVTPDLRAAVGAADHGARLQGLPQGRRLRRSGSSR